jgi:uncharacterized membrane protein
MKFLKTTVIGGLFFLVPLVILGLIIIKAIGFMLVVAEPLAHFLPFDSIGGIALINIVALLIVVLICFLAGLVARSERAQNLANIVEDKIMQRIPGYMMIKGFKSALKPDGETDPKPVLVSFSNSKRLGLEIERVGEDRSVVYFPESPNAWSGIVKILPVECVRYIDIPVMSVIEQAELLGRGTGKLLAGRV